MATQKSGVQGFQENWSKTAAWAQAQGIGYKSYYPIYQMDSARLLAGESPMSTSERTRAILAADNPNNVTPVPTDKPNPTNIWGNTVNDLKNIFTGLAPNHLVANIFDTVKQAIVKPSTWLKPLALIAGGAVSGNMAAVKQGFELAGGQEGPGSILSWLPGVYAAGEFAQGGIGEVLSHPVVSFLDVTPFADAGQIIDAAANASRDATMSAAIAAKFGMTPEVMRDSSLPGMLKNRVLTRKLEDSRVGSKVAKTLVDAKGNPLTIGDALDRWIVTNVKMGKTLSSFMRGMLNITDTKTDYEIALTAPAARAMGALSDEGRQLVANLINKNDARAIGKSESEIMADGSIPMPVRTAYAAVEKARQWASDQALAGGAVVSKTRLDGSSGLYHTAGDAPAVFEKWTALQDAQDALVASMNPNHHLAIKMQQFDTEAYQLNAKFSATAKAASAAVERLDGRERYETQDVGFNKRGKPIQRVTLDLRKAGRELFGDTAIDAEEGTSYGTGRGGLAEAIYQAVDERNFAQVKALTEVGLRRLSGNGVGSIDASLDASFADMKAQMDALHSYAKRRLEMEDSFLRRLYDKKSGYGRLAGGPGRETIHDTLLAYVKARRAYSRAVFDHPTGDWVDTVKDGFVKALIEEQNKYGYFDKLSKAYRDSGASREEVHRLQADPEKMAQLIIQYFREASGNPMGVQILDPREEERYWKSGVRYANKLRQSGVEVTWVPKTASLAARDTETGIYGVHISTKGAAKTSSRAFEKHLDFSAEKHDVMASVHLAVREQLQIDGTVEFAQEILTPRMTSAAQAMDTIRSMPEFRDQLLGFDLTKENPTNVVERIMRDNFKMEKWDPVSKFGFTMPSWDANGMYLPIGEVKALDDMLKNGQFPMDGIIGKAANKATKLFRFSVLGLSPRYTAHVVFGGFYLLALRSDHNVLRALPEAWRIMHERGEVPRGTFDGATQRGLDPIEYRKIADSPLGVAGRAYHEKMGGEQARWLAQETIEKSLGTKLVDAGPVHWLKAVGELNYKFTNWISSFQRSIAYVDHYNKATRGDSMFKDPIDGTEFRLSKDRARAEAMDFSLKVMGDLKGMTPLERNVFSNLMPFYGWTKHILQFVLTYPNDHPFRAQFLSVLATQDSNDIAAGLPKRLQFLAFLGSPDAEGNVTAVDVRSFDPLRDVANYATLSGLISSLNPVITAPLAMIDPNIIFGGNPLYPNVTYDQFYGIEAAGSQGSPLTGLEQVVPQVTALDAALHLSGQYRHLAATNPNSFAKSIFEALNIPFAQVQHLNLKQIAAKDELDRYHVASQLAQNAFSTGDFSAINNLSSVPDPENTEYEVTPQYLSDLYQSLLQEYPGQAPSETAIPPPPAPL